MLTKALFGFLVGLGFAVGGSIIGFAIAFISVPEGWIFLPLACAGVSWTLGFTLGMAHIDMTRLEDDHSPTPPMEAYEVPVVERKMIETPEGGWLLLDFKEILDHGQGQSEEQRQERSDHQDQS